uniref:G_PROTEIN_RECEP_F1_2 domain-containing protein n=1 Tax=Steinernema glaseri TaxID=37863 RepID=A0A1I8ATN7_9BILA
MMSVYVTVLAAFDCYISVSMNQCRYFYCRPEYAKRVLCAAVVIVFLYNLLIFGELKTERCFDESTNTTKLEICPTDMRLDETYITVYRGYMYTFSMAVIPFTLLLTLTVGIVKNLGKHKWTQVLSSDVKVRLSLQSNVIQEEPRILQTKSATDGCENESSPVMLIMVITLFLSCNVVSLVVNILEMTSDLVSFRAQMILIDVGNVLVVFNATANFIVYTIFSKSYRVGLRNLFR